MFGKSKPLFGIGVKGHPRHPHCMASSPVHLEQAAAACSFVQESCHLRAAAGAAAPVAGCEGMTCMAPCWQVGAAQAAAAAAAAVREAAEAELEGLRAEAGQLRAREARLEQVEPRFADPARRTSCLATLLAQGRVEWSRVLMSVI